MTNPLTKEQEQRARELDIDEYQTTQQMDRDEEWLHRTFVPAALATIDQQREEIGRLREACKASLACESQIGAHDSTVGRNERLIEILRAALSPHPATTPAEPGEEQPK